MTKTIKFWELSGRRLGKWLAIGVVTECILIALRGITPDLGLVILLGALTIPGILILHLLRLTKLNALEFTLYSTALSILFIMLTGLGANFILPIFGVYQALSLDAFGPWFCSLLLALLVASIIRNRNQIYKIYLPRFSKPSLAIISGFIGLPILSALGAGSLNNGGSNTFTMLMFGLIALSVAGIVIIQKRVAEWVWPWAIFTMALAILWSNSLRGAFITGHDVQLEYYVFRLADFSKHWSMASFHDAYNACLSITILPTVVKSLTGIDAVTQFKWYYQIIFAIFTTGVFAISRRYVSPAIAFIAAFIFISFPTFLVDMPMLVRQEVAFGYFIVLLLLIFDRKISLWPRRILFSLFAMGLVMSHYSTTFVTVALLIGTYVLMTPWSIRLWRDAALANRRKRTKKTARRRLPQSRSLSLGVVATLITASIVWTGLYTKTGNNITAQLGTIERNLPAVLHGSIGTKTFSNLGIKKTNPSKQTLLNNYAATQQTSAMRTFRPQDLYLDATKYPLQSIAEPKQPLTKFGSWLSRYLISAKLINAAGKNGYALIVQGLVVLALVTSVIYRKQWGIEPEFIALAPVGVAFLAFQTIMPMIEYGLYRMLQQDLVFLALPVTLAAMQILVWLKVKSEQIRTSIVAAGFGVAFLFLTGFIPQLLGGSVQQLALGNSGFYYDAYYTTRADTAMFTWLNNNYQRGFPINSDSFLRMKIMANTGITTVDGITPGELSLKSYVVLANQNVTDSRVSLYSKGQGDLLFYQYPVNFLDTRKDLVYSSGDTKVYR